MSYIVCPDCGQQLEVFGPSRAAQTAHKLGVPLLGRIPLDPELAACCDTGRVEAYENAALAPVVEQVMARMPAEKVKPAFGAQK